MYRNWETLIKPKALEVEEETHSPTYGRFHVEPLERGFGITIGNSLRRILLSSLQGAAITSVRIKGVLHEFSTLHGVREDVTDIILNIKELLVKLHSDGPETLRLKVSKPGVVRAASAATGTFSRHETYRLSAGSGLGKLWTGKLTASGRSLR